MIKAKSKNIDFSVDFSNILNPMITHDEQRIQQILLNLQSNALKFTQEGKVTIVARTYKKEEDEYIEIKVKDTGIGIKV